jgi:insulysin
VGADGDSEPPVDMVVERWRKRLSDSDAVPSGKADELLAELKRLVVEYPSTLDNEGKIADGAILIEDPIAFKTKLEVAKEPQPLVEWGDLPLPKL